MGKTTAKKLAVNGGVQIVPEGAMKPWPHVTDVERQAVLRALDESVPWRYPLPEIVHLEEEWAAYTGAKHCLSTNSGTAALHMAVASVGTEPGDEVIVPAFTFLASASAALHHNAIPVFADIDPVTQTIDPRSAREKITDHTRAIVAVDIHGVPADYDPIRELAQEHGLAIVEDGSQAQGATYKGRKVGNLGDVAGVSLNGSKNLSALCEGGLYTTNDEQSYWLAERVRMFGEIVKPDLPRDYNAQTMGWNYRFNTLEAAFARCQLAKLDEMNATRVANCEYLSARLAEIPGIAPPSVPDDRTHVYFFYVVRIRPEELGLDIAPAALRNALLKAMQAEGVPLKTWQSRPVPGQTLFQLKGGYGKGCPWSCRHARPDISYDVADFPETLAFVEDMAVLGHNSGGIHYPNDIALMEQYAEAFHKVLVEGLDQLVALAKP